MQLLRSVIAWWAELMLAKKEMMSTGGYLQWWTALISPREQIALQGFSIDDGFNNYVLYLSNGLHLTILHISPSIHLKEESIDKQ